MDTTINRAWIMKDDVCLSVSDIVGFGRRGLGSTIYLRGGHTVFFNASPSEVVEMIKGTNK